MIKSICSFVTLALLAGSLTAAPLLTLDPPDGNVTGAPGDTVGWGFSIANDTAFYLVVSSVTPSGFSFIPGVFSDYIASVNFVVIAPNTTSPVEPFNASLSQGFGQYAIDLGATPPDSDSGTFTVSYDLFVMDPNDPLFDPDQGTFGQEFDPITASVTVVDDVDVPEPSTVLLFGAGLAMLLGRRLRAS